MKHPAETTYYYYLKLEPGMWKRHAGLLILFPTSYGRRGGAVRGRRTCRRASGGDAGLAARVTPVTPCLLEKDGLRSPSLGRVAPRTCIPRVIGFLGATAGRDVAGRALGGRLALVLAADALLGDPVDLPLVL